MFLHIVLHMPCLDEIKLIFIINIKAMIKFFFVNISILFKKIN